MRLTSFRHLIPGAMLLVAAGASSALTLGRAQGAALIGRPLEVGIQVGLDSAAEAADLCIDAEVFYGESRVEPRRVDVRTIASGDAASVRVRSALPVDEAYVTVYLQVGCGQKFTRRYVLLTEQPGDLAEASAVATPAAPVVPTVVPGAAAPVPPAPAARASGDARTRPARPAPRAAVNPAISAADQAVPASAAPPSVPARPAPAAQRPRLKLDAVEVRPGSVAPASLAPAVSAASAPGPAPVAATMPDEAARNAERIQLLESDLKGLRDAVLKSNAALADMRTRLEQAESERYANGLVYGLAGLLALASGLAGFLWWRGRRIQASESAWWTETLQPEGAAASAPADLPVGPAGAGPAAATAPVVVQAAEPRPAASAVEAAVPPRQPEPVVDVARPPVPGAPILDADALRLNDPLPLSSGELSDIQQEADFFVSLGEYDRAIEVLRSHIEAHPQVSAVAWLDLLDIHHTLGRRDEYEQLRRDFEWLFNAHAPAFDDYDQEQGGLEAHPRLLERIQRLWPGPAVLEVIDEAIFRRPGNEATEALGLQAYRDLLFLHHIATEMQAEPHRPSPAEPFPGIVASEVPAPAVLPTPVFDLAPQQPAREDTALDINLDDLWGSATPSRDVVDPDRATDSDRLIDFDLEPGDYKRPPNPRG